MLKPALAAGRSDCFDDGGLKPVSPRSIRKRSDPITVGGPPAMEELRSGRKGWCPWGAGNGSGVPSWMVVLSLGFDVSARGLSILSQTCASC